jgi:hypothetical protein
MSRTAATMLSIARFRSASDRSRARGLRLPPRSRAAICEERWRPPPTRSGKWLAPWSEVTTIAYARVELTEEARELAVEPELCAMIPTTRAPTVLVRRETDDEEIRDGIVADLLAVDRRERGVEHELVA